MASRMITEQDVKNMTPQECRDNEEKIHEQFNEAYKGDNEEDLIVATGALVALDQRWY